MADNDLQAALLNARQHHLAGRLDEAEQLYRRVLAQRPGDFHALHLLGVLCGQRGRPDQAAEWIGRAVAANAGSAEAWFNLGIALAAAGSAERAAGAYRQALRLRPDYAEAHANLGLALAQQARMEEAIVCYRTAVQLRPDYAEAFNNLGNAYRDRGWLLQALGACEAAVRLRPGFTEAHNNLGNVLKDLGRLEEAAEAFRTAIGLQPGLAEAHWNLALCLLLRGDFAGGWPEYRWRWRCREFAGQHREFTQREWDGRNLDGRTILVHAEQGLGDAIQFCRYVPMVAARGGRVVLECPAGLTGLLAQLPGVVATAARGEALPAFDVHRHLLDLPAIFRTTLENIPAPDPLLRAPPGLVEAWERRVAESTPGHAGGGGAGDGAGLRVGLAWAGNPTHSNDRNRSIPLAELAALGLKVGRLPRRQAPVFFSLQKGTAAQQAKAPPPGLELVDWTDHLNDFTDTAALIANLDLVVCVDTAVAHLAGAMGKTAWVLLPFAPDWRWLVRRDDSPWYPTMRLFRQPAPGDWATALTQLGEALARWPG